MSENKRALGDITNRARIRSPVPASSSTSSQNVLRPPFFRSDKMAALINYYKNKPSETSAAPFLQFYTDRGAVIANNVHTQLFLTPITDRTRNNYSIDSELRHSLYQSLHKLTFDELCTHLHALNVKFEPNSPKDLLVDTLRNFLLNDINY